MDKTNIDLRIEDLQQAEKKLEQFIQDLHEQEQYVQNRYHELNSWKSGKSADEMRRKMESLMHMLRKDIQQFEQEKRQLVQYRMTMQQLDREGPMQFMK
ncbi:hypothetical protein [Ectobacillus panaciterrae]|uniref:hypothetical protein n=1 Tax=Ectobacillus panaciterrae TaxID=363872 RepID=UPI0003F4FA1B|nr:hypothetical protein [Ectobacillus panaciterrae]